MRTQATQLPGCIFLLLFLAMEVQAEAQSAYPAQEQKIWFAQPAATWNEALPVGNGKLGAMQFGGSSNERLQLNESSVWVGKDTDFVHPGARAALPEVRRL